MKNFISSAIFALLLSGCSISNKIKIDRDATAIRYAATITAEELKDHLSILASDAYEGRETGMPGQKKAAAYIENYYKRIHVPGGMKDGTYKQEFPLIVENPKNIDVSILKYAEGEADKPQKIELQYLKDYYYFGGFNDTTLRDVEMVFVGYGIDEQSFNSYKTDVKGKAVIILEGAPNFSSDKGITKDWDNWRLKLKTAQEKGAVAAFTIKKEFNESIEMIRYFVENPRMQLHNKGQKKYDRIPNCYFPDSLIETLLSKSISELQTLGLNEENINTTLRVNMKSYFIDSSMKAENILGFIEGTDLKEEILVLSAHYDHIGFDNGEICNGADDDGSGTVAVLEIAQAFMKAKQEGNGPRRSILFLNVSGEEKGLLGSQYYTENPIYPLKNTITDLNVDMIGRIDESHENDQYVYLIGADRISTDLHLISEACNNEYAKLELDYTYNKKSDPNRFYYRSDHYNFAKNNIPVIFYFSGVHEDYHKPTDDVEKILFPKMVQISRLIFHTAWELANRSQKPAID